MAFLSLKLLGAEALFKKLKPKGTIIAPTNDQVKITTLKLEAEVKKATPVQFGRLQGSIFSDFSGGGASVGTSVQYAEFVEFGTDTMEARHVEGGSTRVFGTGPFTFAVHKLDLKGVEVQLGDKIEKVWGK